MGDAKLYPTGGELSMSRSENVSIPGMAAACRGPVSRRWFLRAGALGVGGLTLAEAMRARAQAGGTLDTSVIFVWLPGGPPHLDMYDMKPGAPVDYRGPLSPIATKVPGVEVCEWMPLHAACADKYAVIRSIAHQFADHGGGHKRFMTGRDPKEPTGFVNDYPAAPSIVAKCREQRTSGLPGYLSFTDGGRDGVDVYSFGAAYLGSAYAPFTIPGDPSQADFQVSNLALDKSLSERLDDRRLLLTGFDNLRRKVDQSGRMEAVDSFHRQAIGLLTSDRTRRAFDLTQESEGTKARYGRHAWGQRALLARRLVEAGASFVTVVMENPYQSGVPWLKQGTYNWDSHAVNCHLYDDARVRFPIYDQAVTALIEDVYARGLDRQVLIVVTGEFGRTPRIEKNVVGSQTGVIQPGRDHWPNSMSMIISGGGLKVGQVVGSTTSRGETPKDRPLSPNDLWATVYRHLGIDTERSFPDYRGRPMPILPSGRPIAELV